MWSLTSIRIFRRSSLPFFFSCFSLFLFLKEYFFIFNCLSLKFTFAFSSFLWRSFSLLYRSAFFFLISRSLRLFSATSSACNYYLTGFWYYQDLQLAFCAAYLKYSARFSSPPPLFVTFPCSFLTGAIFDLPKLFLGFVQLFLFQSARELCALGAFKYANLFPRAPSFALLTAFGDSRRLYSGF